jgi:hypothetical protein
MLRYTYIAYLVENLSAVLYCGCFHTANPAALNSLRPVA